MKHIRHTLLRALCLSLCLLLAAGSVPALADDYRVNLYQPDTAIAAAPIIMQAADASHAAYTSDTARPSALIATVRLDDAGALTVYDGETAVGSFDALYSANRSVMNIGLRISDGDAAAALAAYVKEHALNNLWLIAADPALIETVRAVSPQVRGIVDITSGIPDMRTLYDLVFGHQLRSVMISAADATSANVRLLQEYDYMVCVEADGDTDAIGAYNLIVSGANAVLTSDSALLLDTLEAFDDYTLTRGATIVGHRGEYTYPNNSLPAFIHAAESGAQSVELDTWLTKDGYVVLSHDDNMSDTQQVADGERDRRLTIAKWEGTIDQLTFAGTPYHYITLDQLFEATAERYPHLIYRIEIKDYRPKNVKAVMALIEEYDLRERCQIICFEDAVTTMARKQGYAVQYLSSPGNYRGTTDLPGVMSKLEAIYRPLNSWWVSTWSNIDVPLMEYMQHYGLAAQPWPTSTENELHGHFIEGYNGLTTDYCHWTNDYVKYAWAEADENGSVTVMAQLYDGSVKDMTAWAELLVLDGSVAVSGMTAKGPGTIAARVRITLPTTWEQNWYYVHTPAIRIN